MLSGAIINIIIIINTHMAHRVLVNPVSTRQLYLCVSESNKIETIYK